MAVLVLRLHHAQLLATPAARPALLRLRSHLKPTVQGLKDTIGFNMAALQHIQRTIKERRGVDTATEVQAARQALKQA